MKITRVHGVLVGRDEAHRATFSGMVRAMNLDRRKVYCIDEGRLSTHEQAVDTCSSCNGAKCRDCGWHGRRRLRWAEPVRVDGAFVPVKS